MFLIGVCSALHGYAQQKYTVQGTVTDANTQETLVGVNVQVTDTEGGTVTDVSGAYTLTIPAGTHTLVFSFIGFEKQTTTLNITGAQTVNIQLKPLSEELEEVVVTASGERGVEVNNVEMGTHKLDIQTIQKLPALLGEVDVVKSLQFVPGVSQASEGSSGFNVRGGSVGQNLVLLDEAPLYNASHMLGFFSAFNPDAVKDVKLYKGAIPARYGGRASSVLKVNMREGDDQETVISGGAGLIFSRLAVEAPIVKDKSSFLFAARRSYIDALAKLVMDDDQNNFGLNFFDGLMKVDSKVGQKSRVNLSTYWGRDKFSLSDDASFSWGNKAATLQLNSMINKHLMADYALAFTRYQYALDFSEDEDNSYTWDANITNYIAKADFMYFINPDNDVNFGVNATYYTFNPSHTVGVNEGEEINSSLDRQYALESAAYISHHTKSLDPLEIEYGVRLSQFQYLGPGTAYIYNDTISGKRRTVVEEKQYSAGETIARYFTPEPRVSVKYQVNAHTSIKASYNRSAQYVHYISNTTASNPLSIWAPSSNNLKPTVVDQYVLGYFREFGKNDNFQFSAEAYYRNSQHEVEYINGAELLSNQYLEGDLISGKGRSYGLELYVQKKVGAFNGWISYTLSRSERQVDGINRGAWYPTNFDQTHNLKVIGMYTLNEKWSISADFVYMTGLPTTYPDQRYVVQDVLIPYNSTNSRNDTRLGSYHRLDLSFRMEGKTYTRKGKKRANRDYWVFSIYNVYAHRNPFSIYFTQTDDRVVSGEPIQAEAHQVSIIGTMVPSVSYNFRF